MGAEARFAELGVNRRAEVLAAAEARAATERDLTPRLEAGELTLDLMGLRDD